MNNFSVDNSFFVIDSDSLDSVESRLYGFTLQNENMITEIEHDKAIRAGGEGSYVCLWKENDKIYVRQDFIGSQGLYLYRENNYFAISNSFFYLVDRIKYEHKMTLNKEYADLLISAGQCSFSYSETLVNEIDVLPRNVEVVIDVNTKKIDINELDFMENSVSLDSEEGIKLLDGWYDKWLSLISNLLKQGKKVVMDLSGGFDTRLVATLFLNQDLNSPSLVFNSNEDGLHTHSEDFEIASQIADRYGFILNKETESSAVYFNTEEDIFNIAFYNKLGFHKQMYYSYTSRDDKIYHFGGYGGATIRGSAFSEPEDEFIMKKVAVSSRYVGKARKDIAKSTQKLISRAYNKTREQYAKFGRTVPTEDLSRFVYRETRNRTHFGKAMLDAYNGESFQCCPLLDPDFQKLDLKAKDCDDSNLLAAVVLDRYVDGLLDFKFDSGRKLDEATIEFAKRINSKYPRDNRTVHESISKQEAVKDSKGSRLTNNAEITRADMDAIIKDMFYTADVKKTISRLYGKSAYLVLSKMIETRKYMPLESAYGAIAIDKIYQDINNPDKSGKNMTEYIGNLKNANRINVPKHLGFKLKVLHKLDSFLN